MLKLAEAEKQILREAQDDRKKFSRQNKKRKFGWALCLNGLKHWIRLAPARDCPPECHSEELCDEESAFGLVRFVRRAAPLTKTRALLRFKEAYE